jgi:hypothetical protein
MANKVLASQVCGHNSQPLTKFSISYDTQFHQVLLIPTPIEIIDMSKVPEVKNREEELKNIRASLQQ